MRGRPSSRTERDQLPAVQDAPSDTALSVTRRQFFNRSVLTLVGFAFAGAGSAVLAFLWPTESAGFGGKIAAGKLNDIVGYVTTNKRPFYIPEARTYIQPYPASALPAAKNVYPGFIYASMQQGIVALYQRCTHLGCRVPWCESSQWFECPCHGSKYNRVGEKRDGPTPRGLDRFQAIIANGDVTVNTGLLALGPPIGTDTTGQVADGPHCVG